MRSRQGRGASPRRPGRTASVAGAVAATALITGCGILGPDKPEPRSDGTRTAEAEPRSDGTGTADAGTSALTVGDCMNDPGTTKREDIPVVPCDEEHVFEAFSTTAMPDGEYPGPGEATTAAADFCAAEFRTFVGVDHDASVLELLYFYPVEESWNAEGDRQILCFVAEQEEIPVTGTLQDAAR